MRLERWLDDLIFDECWKCPPDCLEHFGKHGAIEDSMRILFGASVCFHRIVQFPLWAQRRVDLITHGSSIFFEERKNLLQKSKFWLFSFTASKLCQRIVQCQ